MRLPCPPGHLPASMRVTGFPTRLHGEPSSALNQHTYRCGNPHPTRNLVWEEGFEPPPLGFQSRCSPLSYSQMVGRCFVVIGRCPRCGTTRNGDSTCSLQHLPHRRWDSRPGKTSCPESPPGRRREAWGRKFSNRTRYCECASWCRLTLHCSTDTS